MEMGRPRPLKPIRYAVRVNYCETRTAPPTTTNVGPFTDRKTAEAALLVAFKKRNCVGAQIIEDME